MEWEQNDGFMGVLLNDFPPDEFDNIYGVHMQLWQPTDLMVGTDYFELVELQLDTSGTMGMHVYVLDENGAPIPGVAVAQGWVDGPVLPEDSIPNGGDPRNYPNNGNVMFTDARGVAEWIWGGGEGHDPAKTEGAHWYWIPKGPSDISTDVVYGFGWRWGTNHYKVSAYFQRVRYEPVLDLETILGELFDDLAEVRRVEAEAYQRAADALLG